MDLIIPGLDVLCSGVIAADLLCPKYFTKLVFGEEKLKEPHKKFAMYAAIRELTSDDEDLFGTKFFYFFTKVNQT
jgi:hypothetical protein